MASTAALSPDKYQIDNENEVGTQLGRVFLCLFFKHYGTLTVSCLGGPIRIALKIGSYLYCPGLSNRLSFYNPFIKPMMASGKKVALKIISSLAAQSYVLYNLENIKDGCSMLFSDL